MAEDHPPGGLALLERPLESRFRIEALGGPEVCIADLATDFEIPAVNIRREFNEVYFVGSG